MNLINTIKNCFKKRQEQQMSIVQKGDYPQQPIEPLYQQYIQHNKDNNFLITHFTITHNSNMCKIPKSDLDNRTILSIECPIEYKISICGLNQSGIDHKEFIKSPTMYNIPHEFSISCYDKDNNELSPNTLIKIDKVKSNCFIVPIDEVLYMDISLKIGERFKRKEERFYFNSGIELKDLQQIRLIIVKPNIVIERTELYMKCDLLTKE